MSAQATDWGAGYVTDLPYLPGYYRNQSPLHIHIACLLGGVAGLDLDPAKPLSYLELGCGQGFGLLALAACNANWQFAGIDFNPAHIAAARALARTAGIENVTFLEADLATFADDPGDLPDADVASLHGLWSWVTDPVRDGIVRLLGSKVRPGGVVQISYNALPAWQGALGMQRLVREAGKRHAGRSDRRVEAGFNLVATLAEAKAHHLQAEPFVTALLEHTKHSQVAYLAHEYMNDAWRPCFHADVAVALSRSKLEWVASAQLLENFSELMLSDQARTVLTQFEDPMMRELVKDMCLTRALRQDVFVRGARRISAEERNRALGDLFLGLLCAEPDFAWEVEVPSGKAAFEHRFFGPIIGTLAREPQQVRDLLALPDLPRRDNPSELVGMLVGTEQALPMLALPTREPDPRVARLNVAATRLVRPDNLNTGMALAASGTGSPVPCPMLDLFVAARLESEGVPNPRSWAATLTQGREEAEHQRLCAFMERLIATRAPVWRQLGAIAPDLRVCLQ